MGSNGDRHRSGGRSVEVDGTYSRDGFGIDVQHPAAEFVLLRVRGEVDLWTSFALMEAIIGAFAEHPALIAVDLGDVTLLDAAGLRVLVDAARHAEGARVRFAVILPVGTQVSRLSESADAHPN